MVYVSKDIAPREVQNDLLLSASSGRYSLEFVLEKLTYNLGEILKFNANDKFSVEYKGEDNPVTFLDKECERIAKEYLSEHFKFNFIGEEHGRENNGARYTAIIDPLDGTKSYIRKIFDSSVSIGVEDNGELKYGIVYDFMRGNLYQANESSRRWRVAGSSAKQIMYPRKEILVSDNVRNIEDRLDKFGIKIKSQEGSIALSMAQTAMGIYSGMAIYNPGKGVVWDVTAGYQLLACENDFEITDFFGNKFDYKNPENGFIALNKNLGLKINEVFQK